MIEDFLNKKKFVFFLLNLALFAIPIILLHNESQIIITPVIVFFSLCAIYCAWRGQTFEAILFFSFLSGLEPIIRGFAPVLRYSFLNYLTIVIGFAVFFLNKKKPRLEKEHIIYFTYAIIAILSLTYTTDIISGAWWSLNIFSTLIIFLIFSTIKIDLEKIKKITIAFLFGVTNLAIIMAYYFIRNNTARLGELNGTGPNETAYLIGVSTVIFVLWFFFTEEKKQKIFSAISSILFGTIAFLTLTRGAIIAIILSSLVNPIFEKKKKQIIAIALITIIGVFVVNGFSKNYFVNQIIVKQNYLTSRDVAFIVSLELFYSSPLIGKGIGSFYEESAKYLGTVSARVKGNISGFAHTHNEFSQQLAELGIVGTIPWLVFFILIFRESIKEKTKASLFVYIFFIMMFQGLLLSYSKIILALLIAKGWNKKKSEKNEKNSNSSQ